MLSNSNFEKGLKDTSCKVKKGVVNTTSHPLRYTREQALKYLENNKVKGDKDFKKELIYECLVYKNTSQDSLLKLFSYFIQERQEFMYNLSFFTDKIREFHEAIINIQSRFDNILKSYNALIKSKRPDLSRYILRYDSLYEFSVENRCIHFEVDSKNFVFNNVESKLYTLEILQNNIARDVLSVTSVESLDKDVIRKINLIK